MEQAQSSREAMGGHCVFVSPKFASCKEHAGYLQLYSTTAMFMSHNTAISMLPSVMAVYCLLVPVCQQKCTLQAYLP